MPEHLDAAGLRLLLRQLPAVLWTTDASMRFTSSVGAALEGLGVRPQEVVGRTVQEFFGTDDPAFPPIESHRRALAGEEVTYEQAWAGRAFHSRVTPLRDTAGRVMGCIGVAHDVTPRVEAQRALEQVNAELEARVERRNHKLRRLAEQVAREAGVFGAILASSPDHIYMYDRDGVMRYISQAVVNDVGITREEIIGRTGWEAGYPPEVMRQFDELREAMFKDGRTRTAETWFPTRRGSRRYEYFVVPIRDGGGEINWGLVVSRDITERYLAEEQLRLLQTAVEQAGDAIVITEADPDPPGPKIIYVNTAFERMTGYVFTEAVGQSPRILQGPRTEREQLDRLRAALAAGEAWHGQTINYAKGGREYIVEWHVHPVRDDAGQITHFASIQRDITQRQRAQELARMHQAELAHVTRLSTLGELASGLAHELNQPLAAIGNYARGCLNRISGGGMSDDELRLAFEQVCGQAARAGAIITRMREFVRNREPTREPLDPRELVEDVVSLARPDLRRRKVRVEVEVADTPRVWADRIQIEQVLLNLIQNAAEAMEGVAEDRRRVRIEVRASGTATGDAGEGGQASSVTIRVSDTGPGLSREARKHLFEPFYTSKPEGMGIGLAISESIVHSHDGRIIALPADEEGGGAAFDVRLPMVRDAG